MTRLLIMSALPLLAACATASRPPQEDDQPIRPAPMGQCDASAVQDAIGQRATAELGGELLKRTGARTLRWGPPDTAFTMDHRQDRLNVIYDYDYAITSVRCG